MIQKKYRIAVVGATGAVGRTMLSILEERSFPVKEIRLLASSQSKGQYIKFAGENHKINQLTHESFQNIDIALFSAGGNISKEFAPSAVKAGATVIDNTSHFRQSPDVPLVIPEINREKIFENKGIIANPNCSTIGMLVALKPLHDKAQIKRIVVSTYQAVSGAGQKAIDEMISQSQAILNDKPFAPEHFPQQIAFNAIPHIDVFMENDYTREEMKMVWETKKIMGDDKIGISATCVRMPVVTGHSESVNIETAKKLSADDARALLKDAPGVKLVDDPQNALYPTPIDCAGGDAVLVGRIREDESIANGLNLWVVSNNLRKGAALNAVQIAEELIKGV